MQLSKFGCLGSARTGSGGARRFSFGTSLDCDADVLLLCAGQWLVAGAAHQSCIVGGHLIGLDS
jgi:hypothetical protein